MAPEILMIVLKKPGRPAIYDSRIDCWSAGAMIYLLLKGFVPFGPNSKKLKWAKDLEAQIDPLPECWSKEIIEFVMALLHKNPK